MIILLHFVATGSCQTKSTRNPRVCPENFKGRNPSDFLISPTSERFIKGFNSKIFCGRLWGVWLHLFHLNVQQGQHNQRFLWSSLTSGSGGSGEVCEDCQRGTHRHARMLKICMCSPGKDGCFLLLLFKLLGLFVCCFFWPKSTWANSCFRGELPSFFMPAPGKCRDPSFDACATAVRSPFSRRIVRKIWLQPFPWSNRLRCACYFFLYFITAHCWWTKNPAPPGMVLKPCT